MPFFKFLDDPTHAVAWIEGGEIPLRPAHYYRSAKRSGIFTPDEVLSLDTGGMPAYWTDRRPDTVNLAGFMDIWPAGGDPRALVEGGRVQFEGCMFSDGTPIPDATITMKGENPLILCVTSADTPTKELADRFGCKKLAVEINDIVALGEAIDAQLGIKCEMGMVEYTDTANRNPFLKSTADEWQSEFRLVWRVPNAEEIWVTLPPNIAALSSFSRSAE